MDEHPQGDGGSDRVSVVSMRFLRPPADRYRWGMSSKARWMLVLAAAAAVAAFFNRPVKPPAAKGSWRPAESTSTRH
jgi:hypothetical protein